SNQTRPLCVQERQVGASRLARRIDAEASLGVFLMDRYGRLTATSFHRVLALPIIARSIGRDSKQPRLELRISLKCVQALDHGQEYLLANFLDILPREIGRELEN